MDGYSMTPEYDGTLLLDALYACSAGERINGGDYYYLYSVRYCAYRCGQEHPLHEQTLVPTHNFPLVFHWVNT